MLHGKNVLLGVTGGIAAYKTPDLVRKFTAAGASVRVVLSQSATHFVSALSLQAVSGNTVSTELLDPAAEAAMGHIELAKWADVLVIAPATANTLSKLANGIADDLLTTLYMATTAAIYIAPAMNQQMWQASSVQRNLKMLEDDGCEFIGPASGEQACGDTGPGRMVEPADIVDYICTPHHTGLLQGQHIVITAGPTQEAIDPVRYISNHSSGKMGFALAQAAHHAGATVTLISGPVNLPTPNGIKRIDVTSALSMHEAAMAHVKEASIFIACAAVADYRPATMQQNKIKKTSDELTLTFVKNPDILKDIAALDNAPFTVGFAAESQDVEMYARKKLSTKRLNMIAANDITAEGLGFNSDNNALHVFWPDGDIKLAATSKVKLAATLIELVASRFKQNNEK